MTLLTVEWKDMCVYGELVSARWQREAWAECVKNGNPYTLELALEIVGPQNDSAPYPDGMSRHSYRAEIANRMRQKARKAGVIAVAGKPRRWVFA